MSAKSVRRCIDLFLNTGEVTQDGRKRGRLPKLREEEQLMLLQIVFDLPGLYLEEIQVKLEAMGIAVSLSQICTEIHEMGLSRQKMHFIVCQRSEEKRAKFINEVMHVPANMFVFVDETGSNQRDLHREKGYGLRGVAPVSLKLHICGRRISALAAITVRGVEDFYLVEGLVDGHVFCEYVRNSLLPVLKPFNGSNRNSIVIMDNASIHHVDEVCQLILSSGALLWFLPPYSPDLNPIEECFHQVKSYIRSNSIVFHATSDPRLVLASAFASVKEEDCRAYIKHAGYLV